MFRSVHADREERMRPLPGDDLIRDPIASLTHAVTVERPPRDVWPWLVQMGGGRAGWYSYDFIDNGRQASAERIVPELQDIGVGSIMPAMPGETQGFRVLRLEPEHYLVLGWVPANDVRPIMTWAFVLEALDPGRTRLLVRARGSAGYHPPFGLPMWTVRTLMPWGHLVMQQKQLLGIARRAEAAAGLDGLASLASPHPGRRVRRPQRGHVQATVASHDAPVIGW